MHDTYRIFGLNISSAIPLPAVVTSSYLSGAASDAVIEFGATPCQLSNPHARGVRFQAAPGEFLLRVDGVARFHVQDGNRITITPENNASSEDILPFLMGSAFGALLQQRRILVLHGSAIEVERESVIFCGPSGIGKSTLAAGFQKRGYRFLADDLCAIVIENGQPAVIPGFPRLKLWADALKRLDTASDNLQSIRLGLDLQKFFLPAGNRCEAPLPVRAVFILGTTNTDRMELTPLLGADKVDPLIANSYRMRFLQGLGGKKEHFVQCSAVAAKAEVCRVVRPDKGFLLNELMDLLAERFVS